MGLKEHPMPWAWGVQKALHGVQNYPRHPPDYALVGMDGDEVMAAALYRHDGGREAQLQAIGVSVDVHQCGVGAYLLNLVMEDIAERAEHAGVREVEVAGEVHHSNIACQSLLKRDQWAMVRRGPGTGNGNEPENYDTWRTTLQV